MFAREGFLDAVPITRSAHEAVQSDNVNRSSLVQLVIPVVQSFREGCAYSVFTRFRNGAVQCNVLLVTRRSHCLDNLYLFFGKPLDGL